MNDFTEKFLKIQSEYFKRRQLLFILDLISIFSIFYALFIIFNVGYFLEKSSSLISIPISIIQIAPPVLAFIIAIIGTLLLHKNDHKIKITLLIEEKYPELREKLRTAYDNRDETNVIVDALKSLVLGGMAVVSASKLIASGVVITKIILVTIFISGAAIVSTNPDYRIPPETLTDTFTNISKTITGETPGTNESIEVVGRPENIDTKVGVKGGGDIFGKPKIASIEGKNIDLTLYSGMGTGFEVRDASQTRERFGKSIGEYGVSYYPADVIDPNVDIGVYKPDPNMPEAEKQIIFGLIKGYAINRS